jgi:two-component system response regulator AtoC
VQAKIGKFEAANRGTIFLDEISAMDLNLQSKLLRVLQEREIEPLGSNRKRKLDIRILSATNTDLLGDVKASRFREDLYYRLAVFPITLPPLRDRQGDVALLARHFTEKAAREEGKPVKGLSREAIDVLESYDFPGNVRELENIISHAVVVCQGEWIEVVDLPQSVRSGRSITGEMRALGRVVGKLDLPNMLRIAFPTEDSIPQLAVLEHEMIRYVHALCRGNVRRTAGLLGVSRPLIYRHLDDTEKPDGQA